MKHSDIVGGSTAKRVINCPGSVALCAKMPPKPSSKYADEGTMLHSVIADVLSTNDPASAFLGYAYGDMVLTPELIEEKIIPALEALNEIDPKKEMEFMVETNVHFGDALPGVFGSCDLLGRIGDVAYVLDWKFGSGVAVEVEENPQLLFYAAAAMHTATAQWVFEGAKQICMAIVQPPGYKIWYTTPKRVAKFERELINAVAAAQIPDAPRYVGDHCRWCAAKPVCPEQTGAVERAIKAQIAALPVEQIGAYLEKADMIEAWISDLRALALQVLESGAKVPGYKLVAKRATRKWADEGKAKAALLERLPESEVMEASLISPAQAEKKLKKLKLTLPEDQIVAISSGNTLATEDDPRPAVVLIGQQLTAALSKIS